MGRGVDGCGVVGWYEVETDGRERARACLRARVYVCRKPGGKARRACVQVCGSMQRCALACTCVQGTLLCVCIHSRFSVHRISTMASTDGRDARAAIVAIAAGEIHYDDACDVVSVVARNKVIALAAGGDRKRCFSQRSWELTQRARASKEKTRLEQKRAALGLELEDVWAALAIGDFQRGVIVASGQAAGVLSERDLSLLTLEAATSPTVRGSTDACERRRLLQDRSAAALAAFAEAAQGSFFLNVLSGGRATASESAPWAAPSNSR